MSRRIVNVPVAIVVVFYDDVFVVVGVGDVVVFVVVVDDDVFVGGGAAGVVVVLIIIELLYVQNCICNSLTIDTKMDKDKYPIFKAMGRFCL